MEAKSSLVPLLVVTLVLASAFGSGAAFAQPNLHEQSRLLGNPLSISQEATAETDESGTQQRITQQTRTELLGHPVNIFKVGLETGPAPAAASAATSGSSAAGDPVSPPTGIVLNQHDLYIGGVRVWAGNLQVDHGALTYSGGIAPTQIPIPLLVYPLGPILLQVDAGVEFEGQVQAKFMVGPSYPIQDSTVHADLSAKLYAAAYVEAYARLLFLKGGVGGRIDVIDANAGFESVFYLAHVKPRVTSYGYAKLLSGHVYGFVDFKLFFGRWSRLLGRDFFNWKGKCLNFGNGISPCGV